MIKNYIFLSLFLLSSLSLLGQKNQKVEDNYTTYFNLPRETLHLHLNKTTYVSGEEIWFKGYAYDQKNQLTSKATTNFNIGIYDATGKQVKKALFKGENGATKGNFLIDSTFVSGIYYIKASTNWMKNFNDDGAYIQKIEIYTDENTNKGDSQKVDTSNTEKLVSIEETAQSLYDFQFLPEGGHIVSNTKNNIGFKVTNANGQGVKASGSVYNERNEEITKFESNALGFGKFLFQPESNQKYTSKITIDSRETITQELTIIKDQGISLIINNLFPEKVIVKLNTNTETLKKIEGLNYKLLIHQNGKLKTINFTFDEGTSKTISIPKTDVFKGVNTITLFDKNEQPILERLFFNALAIKKTDIAVSPLNTINDTILLSAKQFNTNTETNISISILPEETESYHPDHSIISSFFLKPYLKGTIENPSYYFTKLDRKRQYELDVLLLTQGWSKYSWNDIFKNHPQNHHAFENGITVRGRVNSPSSGIDKLFVYATKNHPAQFIDLNKDQSFTIKNLYLDEDESIRFSYLDKKGAFKKPAMYVAFNITNNQESIVGLENEIATKPNATNFIIPEDFLTPDSEQLDAIVIEAKKEKEDKDKPFVLFGKYQKVTIDTYTRYPLVTDYLQNNGYRIIESFGGLTILTRNPFSTGAASPLIVFDGVPLSNADILYKFSMANVEKIIIDKLGSEFGSRGAGGVIKIYSRITSLIDEVDYETELFSENTAPYAFSTAKEFYTPKYNNYSSNLFKKYGVISWISEIILKKDKTIVIKIPDTKTKFITLYIEGITKEGDLISQKKTIDFSTPHLRK